ncbi:2-hexaprenyl-6-methoxy-1,4-benzoquinone methyltransferase [Serendipita sp. 396]|nr:2-hexaprenyl-6-methoxy-1,4-benzoquinone methyltransferase [Serendipita sp. 396]
MYSRALRPLRAVKARSWGPQLTRSYASIPGRPVVDEETTHFGYRDVPKSEKENMVKEVFSSVASKYDVMNDAMSMGVHRLWKDEFVSLLKPGSTRVGKVTRCIDVAGGTGDIALRILDYAREKKADRDLVVDLVDINPEMLKEGQKRFRKTMYHGTPQVAFHVGNAQELGQERFPDSTYDIYTIAFGIRNCTDIPAVLREAHRVLKPGGVFACLEFSKVTQPALASMYESYSFSVIPLLGTIMAGDRASYQYLVESIRRFPSQEDFSRMISDAGFEVGEPEDGGAWRNLWGGISAIHTGVKVA